MAKPFCGEIRQWELVRYHGNDTYILGKSFGHPNQAVFEDGGPIRTSPVKSLKWNKNGTVTCHTLNSRYTLI